MKLSFSHIMRSASCFSFWIILQKRQMPFLFQYFLLDTISRLINGGTKGKGVDLAVRVVESDSNDTTFVFEDENIFDIISGTQVHER